VRKKFLIELQKLNVYYNRVMITLDQDTSDFIVIGEIEPYDYTALDILLYIFNGGGIHDLMYCKIYGFEQELSSGLALFTTRITENEFEELIRRTKEIKIAINKEILYEFINEFDDDARALFVINELGI